MHEYVAAPDFLQEDEFGGVVKKVRIAKRCVALPVENESEHIVLDNILAAIPKARKPSDKQPANQPPKQSVTQPLKRPAKQPVSQLVKQPGNQPVNQPEYQQHDAPPTTAFRIESLMPRLGVP